MTTKTLVAYMLVISATVVLSAPLIATATASKEALLIYIVIVLQTIQIFESPEKK